MKKMEILSEELNAIASLRLLIIGSGAVVFFYYLPALRMLGLVKNTTVIDLSDTALRKVKDRYPGLRVVQADFGKFLIPGHIQDSFDAAFIALPNYLHEEAVLQALECGFHVLCEKPLTLTKDSCLRLGELANNKNLLLAVNMERRLLPSVLAASLALKLGLIGELVSIDVQMGDAYAWMSNTGDFFRKENGGVLADFGAHYLDLVEYLVGQLVPISYQDDCADGVEANLEFRLQTKTGIPVRLQLSRTAKLRNTIIFEGKRGELILEKDTFDVCYWRRKDENLTGRLSPSRPFCIDKWPATLESAFAQQFFNFMNVVKGQKFSYVKAQDAASTIGLIEWAYSQRPQHKILPAAREDKHLGQSTLSYGPVVVTGGTGFIGSALVERLNCMGFEHIVVPVRNYTTCANVARFGVKLPMVDLLNYQQVEKAIKGARYVFHLAYGRDGPRPSRITIQGTRNVVEAAIAAGAKSVVILSSIYVFGFPNTSSVVDEKWPYKPFGGEYGQTKAKMEQWCLARARSSGKTRIVILNPSCVYGPGSKTYTEMPAQLAKEGTFFWVEDGRGLANYTFLDNLLDAILLAASNSKAAGQRFIINDGACPWREFFAPILQPWLAGIPSYTREDLRILKRCLPQPTWSQILRLILSHQEIREALKNKPPAQALIKLMAKYSPGLYQKIRQIPAKESIETSSGLLEDNKGCVPILWLADLFGPTATVFSSAKAQTMLGWKPGISLKDGQERSKQWLRSLKVI